MFPVTVTTTVHETPTIKVLQLARPDALPLAPAPAGSHIDVTGPTGVTRPYSLCGPPSDTGWTIAVKREEDSRGGSRALHDNTEAGTELLVSEPRQLFGIAPEATRHHLVAAGIGITPLLAMAYELHAAQAEFTLHYVARDQESAAFTQLLAESALADRVRLHLGLGRARVLAELGVSLGDLAGGDHVYTCGPEGFMRQIRTLTAVPEDRFHQELFQAETDTGGDAFDVEIEGETYRIGAGQSIAEVLISAGVPLDTSCREGICGTCVMGVVEGEPDHRDHCLSASEKAAGDQMAACVSRAHSARLVLELW